MARPHPPALFPAVALALSTLFCAGAVHAQSAPSIHRGSYGVMAGANFAKLGGSDVEDAKTRSGFMAGAYAAWQMAPGWSFQPELLYSMQGVKESDGLGEATLKLDYIAVPLLFRFSPPSASSVRPFIAAGPSLGYQLTCNISASFSGISASQSCDDAAQDTDVQRKKFDLSGRIEAGIDFMASGARVRVGGAYSHGFTDIASDANAKNRVFSVFLAVGM